MDKNTVGVSLAGTDDTTPLSDQAYSAILEAMFQGKLKAGDVVSEFALSKILGISRTPVHLAIRDLMRDGLIQQEGNRRPKVANITRQDLLEIFEMRQLLESEAVRRAAALIGRDQIKELTRQMDRLRKHTGSDLLIEWSRFDDVFHETIARSCGQKRLCEDILRYRKVHFALNSIRMSEELIPQALDEHKEILDALAERNSERAASAMSAHLLEWQAYYTSLFPAGS